MEWLTTSTLLERLRHEDGDDAWEILVGVFGDAVRRFAVRQGLDASAAQDVAQDTLLAFLRSYRAGQYERGRGRLRQWLFGIARNQVRMAWRRRRRKPERSLESLAAGAEGEGGFDVIDERASGQLERDWEQQWQRALYARCLSQVRRQVTEQTYAIYVRSLAEDADATSIASEFGVKPSVVYNARSRVWQRLKECAHAFEDA